MLESRKDAQPSLLRVLWKSADWNLQVDSLRVRRVLQDFAPLPLPQERTNCPSPLFQEPQRALHTSHYTYRVQRKEWGSRWELVGRVINVTPWDRSAKVCREYVVISQGASNPRPYPCGMSLQPVSVLWSGQLLNEALQALHTPNRSKVHWCSQQTSNFC